MLARHKNLNGKVLNLQLSAFPKNQNNELNSSNISV
jgi:hypothetical protein